MCCTNVLQAIDPGAKVQPGNASYCAVQSVLFSWLLLKTVKIKMYKTIILPLVLYGCGTSSLTLRDEHVLRVFETRVVRRIFEHKRDELTWAGLTALVGG